MDLFDSSRRVDGVLHFDGSCWPNPGSDSRCGFILQADNRRVERSIHLGQGTNNTAEYHGLIHGLRAALELGVTHLEVYGDSQLVIYGVRRMKGNPKGKPHLEVLKVEAIELVKQFRCVDLNWICREQNTEGNDLLGQQYT